ncbi:MAG TPA: biopolymer transporter ExbD [Rhizomicrobium sp.]|nr:biopolymer transporter ExbD [Rhizomicrobium sp.]
MAITQKAAEGEVLSELNTTPLIDVLLVLLVLLLLTLPIQTNAVKLVMAGGKPLAPPPQIVNLNIDFDGSIAWNGRKVSRSAMDSMLADAAGKSPQPEIHLTANRLARYDTVAKVMADAQRLGVTNIGIVNTNAYIH